MIIDLQRLDGSRGQESGTQDVRYEDALGEAGHARCDVSVTYQQRAGAWFFHVDVKAPVSTTCHRCLDPVEMTVVGEFDLAVRRGADASEKNTDDGPGEDYIVLGVGENKLDLGPYVHEAFVVGMPMIVRCSEDCRGLCATCGTNLNHNTCDCAPAIDSRWDALRKLGDAKRGQT